MHSESYLEKWNDVWCREWAPPADLVIWQWAEENLELSARVTSYPGPFRSDLSPYIRQPLEAYQDPAVRRVTMCWSAQSGKTTCLLTMLAHTLAENPGPVLLVQSSLDAARSFSKNRLQPLIDDCAVLAHQKTGNRFDYTATEMILKRMSIYLQGAGSPSQLASRPIRDLFADEVDKWPDESEKEADSLSLAEERTKTFKNRKIVLASTPTVERGPIWQAYMAGDQREYFVPCPICGSMFLMQWGHIKFPKTTDMEQVKRETYMECPHCKGEIREKHKAGMLAQGEWSPQNDDAPDDHRSYRLNELNSPWSRWGDLAVKFIQAQAKAKKGSRGALHNFINSSLAETWNDDEHRGESRPPEAILKLVDERPMGVVPDASVGLVCGADSQDDGFWYSIWAFDPDLSPALVREGFAPDLQTLDGIVTGSRYKTESGVDLVCSSCWIDSQGHRTEEIYLWCRSHPAYHPIKGEESLAGRPWSVTVLDSIKARDGKRYPIPGGLQLMRVDTRHYKDTLASKLSLEPGAAGGVRLHSDVSGDLVTHFGAEYKDEKGRWKCPRHKPNHLWDCTVYALAGADVLGVRFWSVQPQQSAPTAPRPRPNPKQSNKWW